MSDLPSSFARATPGVRAATALHEDGVVHTYAGRLESVSGEVQLFVLSPEVSDPAVESAFDRAAAGWERIADRPGVVSVHDRGERPRPWIAVESVDGTRLSDLDAPLAVDEVRTVLGAVAEALRATGRAGVHHGALSPASVRLVDGPGDARIDDWGLERACRVAAGRQQPTPYTAPELATEEREPDDRADVYSLGAIAYYLLTGGTPRTAATGAGEVGGDGSPPRASAVNGSVPGRFDAVLETAMAGEPGDRYATPYEFKLATLFDSHGNPQPAQQTAGGDSGGTAPSEERGGLAGADEQPQEAVDTAEPGSGDEGDLDLGGYSVSRRTALGAVGLGIVGAASWVATERLVGTGSADGVPMFQYDPKNSGYGPAIEGPTAGAEVAWTAESGPQVLQPIVSGGTIYLADRGRILALDASDGDERWSEDIDGFWSMPAVGDDRVYFVRTRRRESGEAELRAYAFDADTGAELWESDPFRAETRRPLIPTLVDDLLVFSTRLGVHGIDVADGTERWRFDDLEEPAITQAIDDEHIYLYGHGQSGLVAIGRDDGTEQWSHDANSLWALTIADGKVYFSRLEGEQPALSAASANTGELQWTTALEAEILGPTAIADGTFFAGLEDGRLRAFDTADGSQVWTQQVGERIAAPGIVADDTVYTAAFEGTIAAFGVSNGAERWRTTVEEVTGIPSVSDGSLFVSGEATLYALTEP